MKRILITGATGFIGANLAQNLEKDHEVHIILRKDSNPWRVNQLKNIKKHYIDLNDFDSLREVVKIINPQAIIHCATLGGFPQQKDEDMIFKTNFEGLRNLIEASSDIPYECFINTGSSSEYGPKTNAMAETDTLEPINAYGISKAAATLYASSYAKTKNRPIITIRLFSPYGYFEEKQRLIPSVIINCLNRETIKIGNPNSARDFIFIEDLVDFYRKIIENPFLIKNGEIYNLGTGEQNSVDTVVKLCKDLTNSESEVTFNDELKRTYDTQRWVADMAKTKKAFSWAPKHS